VEHARASISARSACRTGRLHVRSETSTGAPPTVAMFPTLADRRAMIVALSQAGERHRGRALTHSGWPRVLGGNSALPERTWNGHRRGTQISALYPTCADAKMPGRDRATSHVDSERGVAEGRRREAVQMHRPFDLLVIGTRAAGATAAYASVRRDGRSRLSTNGRLAALARCGAVTPRRSLSASPTSSIGPGGCAAGASPANMFPWIGRR
jgi:hypothetical protein